MEMMQKVDALVAADYINEIECTDGICQQQA